MKSEYNTKQRSLILNFLKESSAHVSVKEISLHLEELGLSVGTATIYRTLDRLCEQGVVRKFVIDERSGACYQYAENGDCNNHFHLKCISCGSLIHIDCDFVAEMERHFFDDHGFTVSSGKTVIYGVCSACSNVEISENKNHLCCKGHKH